MVVLKEKRFAWAYLRRSTDRQEQSIEDQKREVLRFAQEHDVELLRFFIDDAKSGTSTDNRKGFKEMIRLAQEKDCPVNTILVWNIARFGRYDPDEGGYYRFLLRQNGIQICYISEGLLGNDTDDLIVPVKQWLAQEYSRSLARDVIRGKVSRVNKGGSNGQKAPYGYDRVILNSYGKPYMVVRTLTSGKKEIYGVKGKLIRTIPKGEDIAKGDRDWISFVPGDPEKVEAVRKIFNWFIYGHEGEEMGYKAIARALNERGIPSPTGGYWGHSTVASIIKNPFYYGRLTWNKTSKGKFYKISKERIEEQPKIKVKKINLNPREDWLIKENEHDGIMTKAEWLKAQERCRTGNKSSISNLIARGRVNVSSYLLSGLVKCGNCGSNFQGHQKLIKRKKYRYYVCGGYQSKGDFVCDQHYIKADVLEKYVLEQIKEEFFKHVSKERLMQDLKQELGTKFKDGKEELRQVEDAIRENREKIDLLLDAIDRRHKDLINEKLDRLKTEKHLLEEKREHLTARRENIDIERTASEILQYLKDANRVFAKGTPQERKVFVRQLVAGLTISADKNEGILGLYSFPVMGHFGHAEGGISLSPLPELPRRKSLPSSLSCSALFLP